MSIKFRVLGGGFGGGGGSADFIFMGARIFLISAKGGWYRTCLGKGELGNISVTTTTKIFKKSTVIRMGGVLQHKWEAYCDKNGRSTDSVSLSSERRGTESTAIQIGGVLQCKLEVYCDAILF